MQFFSCLAPFLFLHPNPEMTKNKKNLQESNLGKQAPQAVHCTMTSDHSYVRVLASLF